MTWYAHHWRRMHDTYQRGKAEGISDDRIAEAIDQHWTSKRSGHPYKTWLQARRDFFQKFQLRRPRARRPHEDLFS